MLLKLAQHLKSLGKRRLAKALSTAFFSCSLGALVLSAQDLAFSAGPQAEGEEKGSWNHFKVLPNPNINENEEASLKLKGPQDQFFIAIKKSSLGQEFLLQSQFIEQRNVPTFTGLTSRLVKFFVRGPYLYMETSLKGHRASTSLPQKLLLARFKIKEEEGDFLFFDFSEGMERLFVSGDWTGQDYAGSFYQGLNNMQSLATHFSFIDKAELKKNGQLEITQVAQFFEGQAYTNTAVIKYYFGPYRPNEQFVPTSTTLDIFKNMGFFEITPLLDPVRAGETIVYASKFDHKKPIVFHLSSNTPDLFRQAVKEGILYWNKAFGEERIQVKMAPTGVSAPSLEYNIVQWVDYDNAGYAYADAQMDPLTGEILHAQVWLSSTFAFSSRYQAQKRLRQWQKELNKSKKQQKRPKVLGLKGLVKKPMCHLSLKAQGDQKSLKKWVLGLQASLEAKASDAALLKVSQNIVRELVAHEIGHTLGLRHNFAGSLESKLTYKEEKAFFKDLLLGKELDPQEVSSTVMDYLSFPGANLVGDFLLRSEKSLAYDAFAIETLYKLKNQDDASGGIPEGPLFCTDTHVYDFVDCQTWDAGPSYLAYLKDEQKTALEGMAKRLLENFIWAKNDPFGVKVPVDYVQTYPEYEAMRVFSSRRELFATLFGQRKFLKLNRPFRGRTSLDKDLQLQRRLNYIEDAFSSENGLKSFIVSNAELKEIVIREKAHFYKLLRPEHLAKLIGPDGKPVLFNEAEVESIKKIADTFFLTFFRSLSKEDLESLSIDGPIEMASHSLIEGFPQMMLEKAESYIFAQKGEGKVIETSLTFKNKNNDLEKKEVTLRLPEFSFSQKLRVKASRLIFKNNDVLTFGLYERKKLVEKINQLMEKTLGVKASRIIMDDLKNRDLHEWILRQKKLLEALN